MSAVTETQRDARVAAPIEAHGGDADAPAMRTGGVRMRTCQVRIDLNERRTGQS